MLSKNLNNIFKSEINYKKINENSSVKMRENKGGIKLNDSILFRFLYSKKDMTKERIVSLINYQNKTTFKRQSYEGKENNIPLRTFTNIFHKLQSYYNCNYNEENNFKLIAIDGTYNNGNDRKEMLNMCFYDISNGIPIDIKLYGKINKNKEISCSIEYITKNMDYFKNNIIVCDRAYHSYDFFNFLIKNDLKFIIRVKWNGDNLDPSKFLKPGVANHDKINEIKNKVRVIRYEKIIEKIIYSSNSKKKFEKHSLKIKNDCVIVTNLLDENTFSKEIILDNYRSRWDIEVFFKYIKSNFKFQHLNIKSSDEYSKMYFCELIIIYIAKLIEKYYLKKFKVIEKVKINKSNLVNGIFDVLLRDILNGELTENKLNKFCKSYIKVFTNKENRSFPRISKTPFTKWYVKDYHNLTKYMTIMEAIKANDLSKLNKNLRTIAKRIISIDNVSYNFDIT